MDILLDRNTHDIVPGDYDLPLVRDVDLIRQRLKQRILTILGEWFLDTEIGLPWFQEFSEKGVDLDRVRALIIQQIVETEGVTDLVEFNLELNKRTRRLQVSFRVLAVGSSVDLEIAL